MQSYSQVVAAFGKPGTKMVGSTGCVSSGPRRSSWKQAPVIAPLGAFCRVSFLGSAAARQRSGSGASPGYALSRVRIRGQCSRTA